MSKRIRFEKAKHMKRSCSITLSVMLMALSASALETPPAWWWERGVVRTNSPSCDYAALNMGQLRHLAHMAWLEMETLPGGAGFAPVFTNSVSNYAVVTVGQLKEVARPFYDRMGMVGHYPWSKATSTNDAAIVNIGQAKFLFSFDPSGGDFDQDGMSDGWEIANGFNPFLDVDSTEDRDGDGLSNLDECVLGSDPGIAGAGTAGTSSVSQPSFGSGVTGLLILSPSSNSK